jgi:hypothetical protein
MATILLAWELGGGLGHVMTMRPLAEGLARRGHRVVAVLRDLSSAREFITDPAVICLQAPFKHERIRDIEPTCTLAQILHNCGFGNAVELLALAEAWRHLYDQFQPDLVVCEHSPTALLAARGLKVAGTLRVPSAPRLVLIGTGFFSPPDIAPMPNLRTWIRPDENQLLAHERRVLDNINSVLGRWGQPPLDRVAQLYNPVDENFLFGTRELDPYGEQRAAAAIPSQPTGLTPHSSPLTTHQQYYGMWTPEIGRPPEWPPGNGARIFAYLKPFPALPQLLERMLGLLNPILIYAPGFDSRMRSHFDCPNLRFCDEPLQMNRVARECDLAILNGTYTAITMLLAGKPVLQVPIFLEQAVCGLAIERLGTGLCAPPHEPDRVVRALESLLSSDRFTQAARAFAARYANYSADTQIGRMTNRAEELATH